MRIVRIDEYGIDHAIYGLSLSRRKNLEEDLTPMYAVADRLATMDGGHNKFLEAIAVWIDIIAPRYWWQQMATYRIGTSFQSESTMYNIMKRPLTKEDFECIIPQPFFDYLNTMIQDGKFEEVKGLLPEGYLQERMMVTNYKALRNIYQQRKNHKLEEWRYFCTELENRLTYPEYLK